MNKNRIKLLFAALICAALMIAVSMTALAGTWLSGAEWKHEYGGSTVCRWDKCEGAKRYLLTVYKSTNNKIIYGPQNVSGNNKDVTSAILKAGAGSYVFDIIAYADTGDDTEILGEDSSDVIEIDSQEIKKIKEGKNSQQSEAASTDGWHSYPQNTWTYGKGNNTLAKSEWMTIDGKIYYFDSKCNMVKGWQQINGKYYYFDTTNGNLWVNTVTPDGYTVDAQGVWINDSGAAVTGTAVNATVNIKISEGSEVGMVKTANVSGVSNGSLISWSFDTPYESWQPGTPVKLTVVVASGSGLQFNSSCKFTCSNGTVNSFSGTNPATVDITYYPKLKLSTPTNLSVDSAGTVRWVAVNNAGSYTVKIYDGTSSIKSLKVSSPSVEIGDYLDEYADLNVGVVATYNKEGQNSKLSKYYINSDEARFNDVGGAVTSEDVSEGQFINSNGSIAYIDETGSRVKGWKQIAGYWYYFDKNAKAVGPGWWQDSDGNWYYFDGEHRMMTGNVNDGKGNYFLNDGSNGSFPYGAWVQ